MRKILVVFVVLFLSINGFSQNSEKDPDVDMVAYTVKRGETVRLISRKHLIAPSEIYKYNKFATDGIREGMTLYLPVPKKEVVDVVEEEDQAQEPVKKHSIVKEKEEITQHVKAEKIENVDTDKKEIVSTDKKEQVTSVKSYPTSNAAEVQKEDITSGTDANTVTHKVKKQETLYGLSKIYNITVEELKEQNQAILKNGLQIGQLLTIKKNN